jgi:hypothetical protein
VLRLRQAAIKSAAELSLARWGDDFSSFHHPGAQHCNSPVDAAHAEVFDLEEFLDAVFRAPVTHQMGPISVL